MQEAWECYAGIDDGSFSKEWKYTAAVLAVHCKVGGELCPCRVYADKFTVDGLDATEVIARLAGRAATSYRLKLLLLDTVIFAGFNIADIDEVHQLTGIPVAAVFWYEPDREAVRRALTKHFPDWQLRLARLEKAWNTMKRLACPKGGLLVSWRGIDWWELAQTICSLQIHTRHPEPLYTAHMIASTISRNPNNTNIAPNNKIG